MSMRSPTTRPVVVSGSDDATVRVWDLEARGLLYEPLEAHKGKVNAVAVGDLRGRPIAVSGGNDRTVRVWDLAVGGPLGGRWCTTASSTRWRSGNSTTDRLSLPVMLRRRCGQRRQWLSPTLAWKLR
jgi:WD40 repeat protein